jgi:PTS system N-acetylglucosamine-specific IIC component
MRNPIEALQPLGRALMLPIAVLPVAALLLRLGQPDLLDIAFVSAAGDAIFAHLGLLFAVGVATGFAKDGNGAAALAGVVCFLVIGQGLTIFIHVPPEALKEVTGDAVKMATNAYKQAATAKLEVPIGILSGLIGGNFYNRFSGVKLPEYLAFFAGRRFVPIAAGITGLAIAALLGVSYDYINAGMDSASRGMLSSGAGSGCSLYGRAEPAASGDRAAPYHQQHRRGSWSATYQGTTGDLQVASSRAIRARARSCRASSR